MPAVLLPTLDRRAFLKSAALGVAAMAFVHTARAEGESLHLALLSDTHIPADRKPGARGFNACEHLQSIVPDLIATKADGLLIAGDAAQLIGEKEDYTVLLELIKPVADTMPTYIALGNHDDRENFFAMVTQHFGDRQPVEDKFVTVIDHPATRIVILDSLMYTRKRGGFLGKGQRDWLATYLPANTDRPVVLVFHHTLGEGDNDLLDGERLFRLLEPHRHVKALIHGHSHRWELYERQGIKIINLPTVAHIWTPDQPIGWVDAHFRADGMTFTLKAFAGNTADNGKTVEWKWA